MGSWKAAREAYTVFCIDLKEKNLVADSEYLTISVLEDGTGRDQSVNLDFLTAQFNGPEFSELQQK